ncbi:hypothetical protein PSTT_03872, partial [Puccinia striiformis]
MSRRSRLSTLSALSGLSTTAKSNGDELYQYSLRVAYLAYLSSVRLLALKNEESSGTANLTSNLSKSHPHPHRPHLRQSAETWTNTIFSIADVFKDGSGSTKSDKSVKFPKDLVKVLKVRIEAIAKGTDKNYQDLSQIKLRCLLRYLHPRLLSQTIEGEPECRSSHLTLGHNRYRSTQETTRGVHNMPTVKTIGSLFARSDSQLQKDLNNVRKNCSEKAAFEDFKLCVANIAQQCRFPGRRADFDPDEVYREWRTKELAQIQHAMLQMIRANPDLARSKTYSAATTTATIHNSNPNPLDDFVLVGNTTDNSSSPSTLTRADHTSGFDSGSSLGYFATPGAESTSERNSILMRPDSISSAGNILTGSSELHYQHRDSMDQVLDWNDVSDGAERGTDPHDSEELSTTQFVYIPHNPIQMYKALMDQCLDSDLESMKSLAEDEEVAVFFSAICKRFEEEEIPIIDCVSEALTDVFRVMEELKAMSSLFDTLLRRVYEAIESVLESNPMPTNDDNPQQLPNEIIPFLELTASINTVDEAHLASTPSPNSTHPLQPILPDLHLLVGYTPVDPTRFNDADVLELYQAAEKKTSEWVQSAIKADTFSPQGNDSHSNSIIDLEDSCCSAVAFFKNSNGQMNFKMLNL